MSISVHAQNELFLKKDFISNGDTLHYRVLFPQNYDKSKTYPLVIFLHGSGERGNDNNRQLIHGASLFTNPQNRIDYPAIVVFPQCPENQSWVTLKDKLDSKFELIYTSEPTKPLALVKELIDNYVKSEAVNTKKIYVIGLSMGGMGTFDLICRYPKMFAAAVPICGGVNIERLKKVRKMAIRIYNGEIDNVVSPEYSRSAYNELKAIGSKSVEHIEFPGVGHDSWTSAFAEHDFLKWLFSKSK
jgi:predicted peptidase